MSIGPVSILLELDIEARNKIVFDGKLSLLCISWDFSRDFGLFLHIIL